MNQSNTSIKYAGTVSIETKTKRILSHNNGSMNLFNLLNRFMARHTVSVGELPGYLMMYQATSASVLSNTNANSNIYPSIELFTSKTPMIASLLDAGGSEVIVYSTSLSSSNIKSGLSLNNNATVCLALISADAQTILAATDVQNGGMLIKSLQQGMNATVKWQLSFENT